MSPQDHITASGRALVDVRLFDLADHVYIQTTYSDKSDELLRLSSLCLTMHRHGIQGALHAHTVLQAAALKFEILEQVRIALGGRHD